MVELPGYTDAERAEDIIGQTAILEFKLLENYDNAALLLDKLDSIIYAYEVATSDKPIDVAADQQTASDEAEVGEQTADTSDLLAEMMGDTAGEEDTAAFEFDEEFDAEDDTRPLTSRLEQFLLSNRTGVRWPGFMVDKTSREKIDRWLELPQVKDAIPIDVQFAWSTRATIRDNREVWELHLLKRKVQFLGRFLQGINISQGEFGGYRVNFRLAGEGSARFAQLTGANINKPLAIVLDDRVESAAFIDDKIRGDGFIRMGGDASIEDARNLEIVLEAGALPAPVEIIEKNVVGASLGADSISKGMTALLAGLALVLLYIGVYYRISGVIADVGLLFNIFFLLAFMAGVGATLTMPGIAGIILTVGISVDANVLIFERIREELRTGKTVRASIDAGYQRAFVAIFDSHVTTLITAGALFLFGSGPIKGFAVTLFVGVLISLYTAYVITKTIFDIRKGYRTLSI